MTRILLAVLELLRAVFATRKQSLQVSPAPEPTRAELYEGMVPQRGKFKFSKRSLGNLKGVRPDLVRVAHRALELTPYDFIVTEGLRTQERQAQMVAEGKSRTMKSKHLDGRAIDIAALDDAGEVTWVKGYYAAIAEAFRRAGLELGVPIVWGGTFKGFYDGVHFELGEGKA